MNRGKYIVIEGAEGVGKTTMVQLIAGHLQSAGLPVKIMREPDSQNDVTARSIRRLTQDPRFPMNTRTEVLLYNAARSQSLEVIRGLVEQGVICLVDRSYLTTLAIQYYGRGDVTDYERINDIIDFAVGDMQPDLMLVLDAPVSTLRERVRGRYQGERFDNLDEAFLERVRAGYLWEAKQRELPVIYANEDIDDVFKQVWQHITAILSSRSKDASTGPQSVAEVLAAKPPIKSAPVVQPAATQPELPPAETNGQPDTALRYIVPKRVTGKLAREYRRSLDAILDTRAVLMEAVEEDDPARDIITRALLPVAAYGATDTAAARELVIAADDPFATLARQELQESQGAADEPVQLVHYWPRSELSLLPDMLYRYSGLERSELSRQTDSWSYQQKTDVFYRYLRSGGSALAACSYTVELLTDYDSLLVLRDHGVHSQHQRLTPRYGYAVPTSIEKAGLVERLESCFDLSLTLHSKLQAAGLESEAQFATLLGHKLRVTCTITAAQLFALRSTSATEPRLRPLLADLYTAVADVHPLLASRLLPAKTKTS
nr:thymidylate kinase [uncultured bacterium]